MQSRYAIGVDYGTNSVRSLIVDIDTGEEIASSVFDYRHGTAGILLKADDPNLARQSPADYIEGFLTSVGDAAAQARDKRGIDASQIVGIGVDTTGSTPIPVNADGVALALLPEFENELAAQAWLWKDHTSHSEAREITQKAKHAGLPYRALRLATD